MNERAASTCQITRCNKEKKEDKDAASCSCDYSGITRFCWLVSLATVSRCFLPAHACRTWQAVFQWFCWLVAGYDVIKRFVFDEMQFSAHPERTELSTSPIMTFIAKQAIFKEKIYAFYSR